MDIHTQINEHLERASELARQAGLGDILSYARSKEFMAAHKLGHKLANKFSGADAIDKDGNELEYKSSTAENCQGTYTGVSVQPTWPEQKDYLLNDKIGKYSKHFYNRFDKDGKFVESWMIPGDVVYDILLPKFERSWNTRHNRKDPRLSANMTWTEIKKYGKKII